MKRFSPFSGVQVSLFDATYWTSETADAIRQRINSDLYNPGVVNGLTVFASGTQSGLIAYTAGVAYDINGERIGVTSLQDRISYNGSALNTTDTYQVALQYTEGNDGTYGLDVDGLSAARHVTDSFRTRIIKVGTDSLPSDAFILSRVYSTVVGGTLIVDSTTRDTFSAKYGSGGSGSGNTGNLVVSSITASGASFSYLFVNNSGMAVTGVACFFKAVRGMSDIRSLGDFYADTAGKGLILTSPDGTKRARFMLSNDGFVAQEPLNYTIS